MASFLPGDPSQHGVYEGGIYKASQDKQEESCGKWYFSRKEIEENSPSRQDGIDLKKETYLRKSYCTFLQDLGMRLKVPQVTIATAIIFCHRFFLRQSHVKNDRRTIATVCMFLAGKVEETPRPLKDVIMVSYEIIHKKDPAVSQRIKQKEVYEQQKELILLGERVVLATLAFDLNVHHPYKPLVEAIKKFKVAQNALAQVAWNFVNDGLRTSLCLQFKPHHIAAGAIFLAAKFLKVKLPSDGEKVWWQEFDVTPRQLEEVSNQMLELYEQNRVPPSQASEAEGSAGGSHRTSSKMAVAGEENTSSYPQSSGATSKIGIPKPASSRSVNDQSFAENPAGAVRGGVYSRSNDYGNSETHSLPEHKGDEINNTHHHEREQFHNNQGNSGEINTSRVVGSEAYMEEEQEKGAAGRVETRGDTGEFKDKYHGRKLMENKDGGAVGQSPQDFKKQLGDKVKAVREKRKKLGTEVSHKTDLLDEEELIERQLEDEIVLENPRNDREKKQQRPTTKPSNRPEHENAAHHGEDFDNVEEGEVEFDDADRGYPSPKSGSSRKRKAGSPVDKSMDVGNKRHDYLSGSQKQQHSHGDFPEDSSRRMGRHSYSEQRDHKRQHVQENHV